MFAERIENTVLPNPYVRRHQLIFGLGSRRGLQCDLRLYALMACVLFGICSCAGSVGPEYDLSKPHQIMCEAGPDCDAKWARANTWVTENSGLKIQTKTNSQIKTVQSTADSRILVVSITKNATSKPGVYEISFIGGCPSPLSCLPPIAESRAQFAKFVPSRSIVARTFRVPWLLVRAALLVEEWPAVSGREPIQEECAADQGEDQRAAGTRQQRLMA